MDNYQYHENDRNIDVKIEKSYDQYIHCGVYDVLEKIKYWLTTIYGKNQLEQRKVLWKDIIKVMPTNQDLLCLIGDFNNVTRAQDRIGGRMVTGSEYIDLQEMMTQARLNEMDSCGDYFTWCNRHTIDTIHSRIDRLLGNVEWFRKYMDTTLKIPPPSVSDHALLQLVNDNQTVKKARRFKFLNCITDMVGCKEVVRTIWNKPLTGNPMFILWIKLHRLKPELNQLSKSIANMKLKMEQVRTDLE